MDEIQFCARQSEGAGILRKGKKMGKNIIYEVQVGIENRLGFHFDCIGDAVDFAATCLDNGYRIEIIPIEDTEEV